MRIFDNGEYRDATPEEIAELEALMAATPPPEPTTEEKIAALLAAIEGGIKDA
nr:MAG TPA: pepsin inhibitor [Caudoviricetes sp.]